MDSGQTASLSCSSGTKQTAGKTVCQWLCFPENLHMTITGDGVSSLSMTVDAQAVSSVQPLGTQCLVRVRVPRECYANVRALGFAPPDLRHSRGVTRASLCAGTDTTL